MARLEVGIGATNKELKSVLADSETLVRNFSNNLKRINIPLGGGLKDFRTQSQQATLSLKDQKVETERMRTEAAKYRAQIAAVTLELKKLALEKSKDRANTTAASGSYREAQQRLTAMGKAIREAAGGFNLNSQAVQMQIAQYRQLNAQLKAFDAAMGNHQRNVGNYPTFWSGMSNGLQSVAGSYLSVIGAAQGLSTVIKNNAALSDSIADIQRTASLGQAEARGLVNELKGLETRTSIGELAEIAVIGGQLGIAKNELTGFTEAVDMLAVVLKNEIPGGAESVTEALGKINGVFRVAETEGLTAGQAMQKTGSAILALGQAGLATGEFMVDFTQRVGGAARTVGIALPTVLAYGAVLEEAGVSAEVAGTAVSKLIGQLAAKRQDFHAIAQMADANLTIKQFTDLINTDAEAAMRKFFAGLAAGGKTTTQFYDILNSAGIKTERYRNAVLLLSQDQEKLAELTSLSTLEYEKGTKAAEQFVLRNTTLGASLDKLSKSFQVLTTSGNLSDFFKTVTDSITGTIDAINNLANAKGWEFIRRASTITLLPGNIFGSAKISDLFGGAFSDASTQKAETNVRKQTSFISQFAKMGEADMKRLIAQQEKMVQMRSDTYQGSKSQKNLEELNYQAQLLAQMRMEYGLILKAKEDSVEVSSNETKLTKEQLAAIEQQRKESERYQEHLRKMRETAVLETLEGYERELQAARYKWEEELKDARHGVNELLQLRRFQAAETARILKDVGMETSSGRVVLKSEPVALKGLSRQLNLGLGEVVPQDWSRQIAERFKEANGPELDWSEFSDGLKRVTNQFTRNMMGAIEQIGGMTEKKGKDVIGLLGNTLIDSFGGIAMNVVSNKLQKHLNESFDNLGKGLSENTGKWLQIGIVGAGLVGQGVSGISSRTNTGAQVVGGVLKGAAAGASFGSIVPALGTAIGAAIGAVIGGISGWLGGESAKRQEEDLLKQSLEEQKKQTEIMRRNALSYTSQIIGQQTNQGLVTGVDRDEFGNIRFRIEGQDLVASLERTDNGMGRGM